MTSENKKSNCLVNFIFVTLIALGWKKKKTIIFQDYVTTVITKKKKIFSIRSLRGIIEFE